MVGHMVRFIPMNKDQIHPQFHDYRTRMSTTIPHLSGYDSSLEKSSEDEDCMRLMIQDFQWCDRLFFSVLNNHSLLMIQAISFRV
ncbi:unnamed protein product [Linum trigynum]|uniref:Uncharacterized protein n=1 Tax=Linum trigynum TaxID=586398 RepID=A0AAV2FZN6_9ROSI